MNTRKQHFIATSDHDTAQKLRDLGFMELQYDGERWFFLNDNKMTYSSSDLKVAYTDKITL